MRMIHQRQMLMIGLALLVLLLLTVRFFLLPHSTEAAQDQSSPSLEGPERHGPMIEPFTSAGPSRTPQPRSSVSLLAQDPNGLALPDAKVLLVPIGGPSATFASGSAKAGTTSECLGHTDKHGVLQLPEWPEGRQQLAVTKQGYAAALVALELNPPPQIVVRLGLAHTVIFRSKSGLEDTDTAFRVTLANAAIPMWHAQDPRASFVTLRTSANGGLAFRHSGAGKVEIHDVRPGWYFPSIVVLDDYSLFTCETAWIAAGISVPTAPIELQFVEAHGAAVRLREDEVLASSLSFAYRSPRRVFDDERLLELKRHLGGKYPDCAVVVARPVDTGAVLRGQLWAYWRRHGWIAHDIDFAPLSKVKPMTLTPPSSAAGGKDLTGRIVVRSCEDSGGKSVDMAALHLFLDSYQRGPQHIRQSQRACAVEVQSLGQEIHLPPGRYSLRARLFPWDVQIHPSTVDLGAESREIIDVKIGAEVWRCKWDFVLPGGDSPQSGCLQMRAQASGNRESVNLNPRVALDLLVATPRVEYEFSTLGFQNYRGSVGPLDLVSGRIRLELVRAR